jgi:hypothetical protein
MMVINARSRCAFAVAKSPTKKLAWRCCSEFVMNLADLIVVEQFPKLEGPSDDHDDRAQARRKRVALTKPVGRSCFNG